MRGTTPTSGRRSSSSASKTLARARPHEEGTRWSSRRRSRTSRKRPAGRTSRRAGCDSRLLAESQSRSARRSSASETSVTIRDRPDPGRQHEVQAAFVHLLVVAHEFQLRGRGQVVHGRQRPQLRDGRRQSCRDRPPPARPALTRSRRPPACRTPPTRRAAAAGTGLPPRGRGRRCGRSSARAAHPSRARRRRRWRPSPGSRRR